eukprot:15344064-Ditylum_brightwellii.AAC.1
MREIQQLIGKKKSDAKQQQQQNVTGLDFSIDIPRKIPPQWHQNVPMRMKPSSSKRYVHTSSLSIVGGNAFISLRGEA